ncbi:MAG: RNA-binding protein [Lentisphaeraceae bacterium]|nr:RNA-binding protein [Lentisphaeraceae bacterium]
MDIYVGNLSYSATEEDIKDFFSAYGEVKSVRIIMDKETGRSKGFSFVEMPNADEANAAIEATEGAEFQDRNLRVNEAKPRENNNRGGGNRGGGGGFNRGGGNRGGGGGGGFNRDGGGNRGGNRY